MKYKGQSAIEFIILLGAVIFFFSLMLVVLQSKIDDKARERRDDILNDIVLTVQQEVSLANRASDGYERTFALPDSVLNIQYEIRIDGTSIYAHTLDDRHALSLPVANVTGQPHPGGDNRIRKTNGAAYLN